jgi:N-acetylmuramoyl-L-alanine amidase
MPSVLVETGFVTGNLDSPRLATASHRRRLSLAIATGILEYLQGVR